MDIQNELKKSFKSRERLIKRLRFHAQSTGISDVEKAADIIEFELKELKKLVPNSIAYKFLNYPIWGERFMGSLNSW